MKEDGERKFENTSMKQIQEAFQDEENESKKSSSSSKNLKVSSKSKQIKKEVKKDKKVLESNKKAHLKISMKEGSTHLNDEKQGWMVSEFL